MQLSLASRSNGVSHVDWRGRITQRDLSPFSDPLADLLGADAFGKPVLLNLQEVEIIDSSGVSYLLTCHKKFREAGGKLVLHSVSPLAAGVFKVLNLTQVFCLAEDEASALRLVEGDTT
ncbi:MAG: STAS domain-containing protein [Planctomycetales bacterium]|nr:STAS domain-containing protein [Planctomycetales bacterium]